MGLLSSVRATFFTFLLVPSLTLASGNRVPEPKEFDRLDGTGPSGKKVNVIEWEDNLEIHVYPKGGLAGLGLKIDRKDKNKPVMVIEYAFKGASYTVIRRAIIAVPLKDEFKTYQEQTTDDYDKIIVSNHTITASVKPFRLNAAPVQLYPDYHPALQLAKNPLAPKPKQVGETRPETYSARSSEDAAVRFESESSNNARRPASETRAQDSAENSIDAFSFK
ncbi:MAG: hypothetical protein EOP09_09105 [Proteobacteria bacterium]|nr:MAG: hypothetical protein EOP09_09105 [Pseudomonadota bacterium]